MIDLADIIKRAVDALGCENETGISSFSSSDNGDWKSQPSDIKSVSSISRISSQNRDIPSGIGSTGQNGSGDSGRGVARAYLSSPRLEILEILEKAYSPTGCFSSSVNAKLEKLEKPAGLPDTADWLARFDERAAIREFDGEMSRIEAEIRALADVLAELGNPPVDAVPHLPPHCRSRLRTPAPARPAMAGKPRTSRTTADRRATAWLAERRIPAEAPNDPIDL